MKYMIFDDGNMVSSFDDESEALAAFAELATSRRPCPTSSWPRSTPPATRPDRHPWRAPRHPRLNGSDTRNVLGRFGTFRRSARGAYSVPLLL